MPKADYKWALAGAAMSRKRAPTLIMRGQFDGIAGLDDLLEFYKRPPNPDMQFAMPLAGADGPCPGPASNLGGVSIQQVIGFRGRRAAHHRESGVRAIDAGNFP